MIRVKLHSSKTDSDVLFHQNDDLRDATTELTLYSAFEDADDESPIDTTKESSETLQAHNNYSRVDNNDSDADGMASI